MRSALRRIGAVPVAGIVCAILLGGCQSDDDIKPSPIPPGYALLARRHGGTPPAPRPQAERGEKVDELLAVVDGNVLTRREVLRRLRLPEEGKPDRDTEAEIRRVRLQWAQQQLVVGAARRAGLRLPPSAIDNIAERQLKEQKKQFEKKSGQTISRADYLAARKLTWQEFRDQMRGAIIYEFYMRKVLQGMGDPTRPEVDYDVSPAEVRRIYYDNRKAFDIKRGVKHALFQIRAETYETEDRDFLEAEEYARAQAERLAAGFRRGEDPAALAKRFRVPKADWIVAPRFIERFLAAEGHAFLFDPKRRARDAVIFDEPSGPIVLGVVAIRPARQRTLNEVTYDEKGERVLSPYDTIVRILEQAKKLRLTAQLTLDQLSQGSVVWPEELADELLDEAQGILDGVAADPILRGARLK